MSTYKPNARGDLPGPGDFSPPDEEELDEYYLERAREKLEASLGESPPEDRVVALAWELQDKAHWQAADDAAEMRYLDKLDGYDG